jgi:hypothetical protein
VVSTLFLGGGVMRKLKIKWRMYLQTKTYLFFKDPRCLKFDLSAFDEFKHKELWQLEMVNRVKGYPIYDVEKVASEISE